jgi:hypothetical protein
MSVGIKPTIAPRTGRFRFFVSYAREDYNIAIAVSNAIQTATGPAAEVFMDVALQFGANFYDEIKRRLDETNVLVVIHSGILKAAFAYPGLELGYFLRVMEGGTAPDCPRLIVPIYLEKPPDTVAAEEGINIGISRATLNLTVEAYKATIQNIDFDNSGVRLLRQLQELIDSVREQHGQPKIRQDESQRDLPGIVAKMQLAIFSHLKTTADPEGTLKPQYQITLKTSDGALAAAGEGALPDDVRLVPVGPGTPMSIFGLPSTEMTWAEFQQQARHSKFCDSWVDSISQVVTFSLKNQLAKDNSQVIVSYDGKEAYRVILTTGVRYFNGNREFNIYFVELLRRRFGDPGTTLLFEGLELACRFRSLFLERNSEFSSTACKLARPEALKDFASNLERELNLLRRDALDAGIDDAGQWVGLANPDLLVRVAEAWRPLELRLHEAVKELRKSAETREAAERTAQAAKPLEGVESHREPLVSVLKEIETTMRPLNADVIAEMAEKLKTAPPL